VTTALGRAQPGTDALAVPDGPRRLPGSPAYSRTLGGRSRSNMWTVSTKRTVLVW